MRWSARLRRSVIELLLGPEAAERTARAQETLDDEQRSAATRSSRHRLGLITLLAGPEAAALTVAIRAAFDAQRRAEDRLRSFVADAGHELRTPLATVHGWIDLYAQGGLSDPGRLDHAMERMQAEVGRMRLLVEELSLLAHLDAARPLDRGPVDVATLAGEVVDDARVISAERSITLDTVPEAVVDGDGPRIQQVLRNLVGNAVQHTRPGTPVTVTVSRPGGKVIVEVRDEGDGIAPEHLPHVFERFFRADPSRGRDGGGSSGLGLSIVEAIMTAHGGTAEVTSALGQGTGVRVTFPPPATAARPTSRGGTRSPGPSAP